MYRTKVPQFLATYEKVLPEEAMATVPKSAVFMNIDDQEGNQLWRFVVMTNQLD